MSNSLLARLPDRIANSARYLAGPITFLALTRVAFAQAVAGAVDPETGLQQLAPWLLVISTGAIVLICMYKGVHAVAEGRSFGPILIGLITGMGLCFGGYYVLSNYGAGTTI